MQRQAVPILKRSASPLLSNVGFVRAVHSTSVVQTLKKGWRGVEIDGEHPDIENYDLTKGYDINSDEDPHPDMDTVAMLKKAIKECKGYPHPYDEPDPDQIPGQPPKKAKFPF